MSGSGTLHSSLLHSRMVGHPKSKSSQPIYQSGWSTCIIILDDLSCLFQSQDPVQYFPTEFAPSSTCWRLPPAGSSLRPPWPPSWPSGRTICCQRPRKRASRSCQLIMITVFECAVKMLLLMKLMFTFDSGFRVTCRYAKVQIIPCLQYSISCNV